LLLFLPTNLVLKYIKDAQSQHGLKHGDYHRYRVYCTHKIKRLRKSLGFVQASGSRFRSTFQAKSLTNEMVTGASKLKKDPVRFLLIPLMSAERCWSYAMALKQEANTEPRKKFHLLKKFKKAVKYSQVLEKLCNEPPSLCDAKTKLETQAYAAYLSGIYYFEIESWVKAQEYLKKAQAIYMKLCDAVGDDESAFNYRQKVDELKPTLRYCAFNIGDPGVKAEDFLDTFKNEVPQFEDEILSAKFDQLILQAREKYSATLSEVTWLGKTIPVKHEKIRSFLLTYQEFKSVELPKVAQTEKLLFECRDCIQLLRDGQDKSPLYCYLLYLRLDLTCKRNLALIESLENASDLIRPYEVLISTLNEIKQLPLKQYFVSDEEMDNLLDETEARTMVYKASRCYYAVKVAKLEWRESVALLHQAAQYCESCLSNQFLDQVDATLQNHS